MLRGLSRWDSHAPLAEAWQMLWGARCTHLGNSYLKRSSGVLNLDACVLNHKTSHTASNTAQNLAFQASEELHVWRGVEGPLGHVARGAFEGAVNRDGGQDAGLVNTWTMCDGEFRGFF